MLTPLFLFVDNVPTHLTQGTRSSHSSNNSSKQTNCWNDEQIWLMRYTQICIVPSRLCRTSTFVRLWRVPKLYKWTPGNALECRRYLGVDPDSPLFVKVTGF
ncbi:unnamed protein product [Ilex paraguariensis]|uniref:DDE-1 domain-containing protein n=1 Tax=Ilex paraguariensis TaxID=185542 RepID=A0ABC8RVC2_9AQUA